MQCPRCRERMIKDNGEDGRIWRCLACGSEEDTGTERGLAPAGSGPVAVPDWRQSARKRLDVIIAAMGKAAALQAEAERIFAALTAYGDRDLPALPWRKHFAREGSPPGMRDSDIDPAARRRYGTDACVYCGHLFTKRSEKVTTTRGTICRSERLCAERAAKAG